MRRFGKITCMILALAMVFTTFAALGVSAAGEEHSIILKYDSALGTVEINPPEPTVSPSEFPYSIDKAMFNASGSLEIALSYHGAEASPSAKLVVASYDRGDEKLLLEQRIYNVSGTEIKDYDNYNNPKGGSVKVFVWKDDKGIEPLAEPKTAEVSGAANYIAYAAADNVWEADKTLSANTSYEIIPGITVTTAEDFKLQNANATIDGISFPKSVKGSNNGNVAESGVSGVVMRFDVQKTGKLSVAVNLGAGKGARAVNTSDIKKYLLDYSNSGATPVTDFFSFDVVAGQSYYFWPTGTKPNIYGVKFDELIAVPMKAGETVRVVSRPNSNAMIGKVYVTAGGADIDVKKNSDMTECTFVMPDSDVNVNVDFLSNEVISEISALSFDTIKGSNTDIDHVNSDLVLFDGSNTKIGYADVKWESSDPGTISISGEVNTSPQEKKVALTAVYTYQDYPDLRLTKTFNITVPADTDDAAAVAEAKAALTLGDTSAVKSDIELPDRGKRSTSISWSSSNPEVLEVKDGMAVVHRAPGKDAGAVLTATISRNGVTDTKSFDVTVLGYVPVAIDRIALSNAKGDVVMSPADGCHISHIMYEDSIPDEDRTGNEVLVVEIYNADQSQLLKSETIALKDLKENVDYSMNYSQTILYVEGMKDNLPAVPAAGAEKLPVSAGCIIKAVAKADSTAGAAALSAEYIYNLSVAENPTIYVAGDSTACTYAHKGSSNRFPQTGWAQVLQDFFDKSVVVSDLALSGRTSLNFLREKNYTTIKNNIKSGDYFIVQFGHNDEKENNGTASYTDPTLDRFADGSKYKSYKKNITDNYVNFSFDRGAYPILATSISRRGGGPYAHPEATKELSRELGVPLVDMYAKTNGYIKRVGEEKARDIYNYVKAHDSRFVNLGVGEFAKSQFYAGGTTDNTHINYFGAQIISQWFCDELTRIGHPLVSRRNTHTMTEADLPSYADATSVK